jgi:hypothetical protein
MQYFKLFAALRFKKVARAGQTWRSWQVLGVRFRVSAQPPGASARVARAKPRLDILQFCGSLLVRFHTSADSGCQRPVWLGIETGPYFSVGSATTRLNSSQAVPTGFGGHGGTPYIFAINGVVLHEGSSISDLRR